ncbi:MAG: hypothetical protein ABJH68_21920 [Ilumatobacter sp.]|uniref:hypothetical protein n=1 Tax=Ilumatobacter sp. TaxID=1967498 RepID=UPI003296F254
MLVDWQPWEDFNVADRSASGDLELEACRWRGPGAFEFDVRWEPDGDVTDPVMLEIGLQLRTGDIATGWGGTATVSGAGSFAIPLELDAVPQDEIEAYAGRSETTSEWANQCSVVLNVPDDLAATTEVAVTVDPEQVSDSSAGVEPVTVSDLAATVDVGDIDDPLLPLPRLLRSDQLPAIDKLYLLANRSLDYIEVNETGGCVEVRSRYGWIDDAEPFVELLQSGGCPGPLDGSGGVSLAVDDDFWKVSAFADDTESLGAELRSYLFPNSDATVDPVNAGFDADRFLDASIADSGVVELARFDWLDGRVAAVQVGTNNWGGEYGGFSATAEVFIADSSSVMCRERGVFLAYDATGRSYALVFARGDRTAQVDLADGANEAVDLMPTTLSDWSAGLVDLTGTSITDLDTIRILNSDGSETPCDQNSP